MSRTIEVPLTEQHCPLGQAYARRHLTSPPKTAVLSCEGACLRGEIARRAATLLARDAPDRFVRVCHGGLLETGGGMRELVSHADRVLMLDGCAMSCGARLLGAAMPEVRSSQVVTDGLFQFDRALFSQEDMGEAEIGEHARSVAERVRAAVEDGAAARACG